MNSPNAYCDCCGLPINLTAGEDCPRCTYPVDPKKEERFLTTTIRDLERVATHGGANITVTDLIRRYQFRLNILRRPQASTSIKTIEVKATSEIPVSSVSEQVPITESQPVPVPALPALGVREPAGVGIQQRPPARHQAISFRTFFVDQSITIVALLGAFLILIGSLSFVVNTPDFLLSFLVTFGVQALFGIVGVVANRFPRLRIVARIYTGIFAFLVPITGLAGYGLIQGNYVHLSVPALIAIAAIYAATVYAALAIYQRFALFGYLGAMALIVADLSLANVLNLGLWWWPSMLMLLALPGLTSEVRLSTDSASDRKHLFSGSLAVLRDPVRISMYVIIALCALSLGVIAIDSTNPAGGTMGYSSTDLREMRFSILSLSAMLLIWISLYLWLTKRSRQTPVLAYMFLITVLAFCYAFEFQQVGYVLLLTGVAVLYHALNRFALRRMQAPGHLDTHLNWLAIILIAIIPIATFPLLPLQLLWRAANAQTLLGNAIQSNWQLWAELLAVGIGLFLSLSIVFSKAGIRKIPDATRAGWIWLFLLSGFLLNWIYGVVVLVWNIEPVWFFLGLTLVLLAGTMLVRRFTDRTWSNPIDVVVLVDATFTALLSLWQSQDTISTLLLFFAALSYAVLLYQRRAFLLFIPVLFALCALPILVTRPHTLLLIALLLPLSALVICRLFSNRVKVSLQNISNTAVQQYAIPWEWPLLATGLIYTLVIINNEWSAPVSIIQDWTRVTFPVALEFALFAVAWYISAALARRKLWLISVILFSVIALVYPGNVFWVLALVTFVAAVLSVGISRITDRVWALPLYTVALLGAVMAGLAGYNQGQLTATTWVLLGFGILAYIIGVLEDWQPALWLLPLFVSWSVAYSTSQGDFYQAFSIVLVSSSIGIGIRSLKWVTLPSFLSNKQDRLLQYALPFYATALSAAILTGGFGMVEGINQPFYTAIPDALLAYVLIGFGVILFERRPGWLWLVAGFALWGITLGLQTNAYYVAGVGLGIGVPGLLAGLITSRLAVNQTEAANQNLWTRFQWNWPWYIATLCAALFTGLWSILPATAPMTGFIGWSLSAFALLMLLIMLVERTPELLIFPVAFAAWAIGQWQPQPELALQMALYTLLCLAIFVSQFVWKAIPALHGWLQATTLHRLLGPGGLIMVILAIIAQNGLSADSGFLAHVGVATLFILALLLYWYGNLQSRAAIQHLCVYGAGLLIALMIPWELSYFRQTNWSLLCLAPASYLIVIAPIASRDRILPAPQLTGNLLSIFGTALLVLPATWLSFSESETNLLYTLILMGESLVLLMLGIVTHMRIFALTGSALIVVAALHALFLPSLGIPTSIAVTILGIVLVIIATTLSLTRHRLRSAWNQWQ